MADQGRVEVYPRLDGRNMTMVLGPDKKAQAAAEKRRQAEAEEHGETPAPAADATDEAIDEAPADVTDTAEA